MSSLHVTSLYMCVYVLVRAYLCEREGREGGSVLTVFEKGCGIIVRDESVDFISIKHWGQRRIGRGYHTDVKLSIGGSVPSGVDTTISQVWCFVPEGGV